MCYPDTGHCWWCGVGQGIQWWHMTHCWTPTSAVLVLAPNPYKSYLIYAYSCIWKKMGTVKIIWRKGSIMLTELLWARAVTYTVHSCCCRDTLISPVIHQKTFPALFFNPPLQFLAAPCFYCGEISLYTKCPGTQWNISLYQEASIKYHAWNNSQQYPNGFPWEREVFPCFSSAGVGTTVPPFWFFLHKNPQKPTSSLFSGRRTALSPSKRHLMLADGEISNSVSDWSLESSPFCPGS